MPSHRFYGFALVAGAALLTRAPASADWVVLKDGTRYQGKVLDETGPHVVADVMDEGRRATKAFKKTNIKEVIKEELPKGFFEKKASTPGAPASSSPAAADPKDDEPLAATGRPYYVEIPLVGVFGQDFDETGVEEALASAKRKRVENILITLESPGGVVATANAIQTVLTKYDADFTYYVRVKEALSASLWVMVCADRIFFEDGANAGAAVAFKRDVNSGAASVDAKMTAAVSSQLASLAEKKRRLPPLLVRAMVDDEVSVFVHKDEKSGRSKIAEAVPAGADEKEWTELDSKTQVLALSKQQAIELGFGEDWNTRDVFAADWRLASKIGEAAMARSKERVKDFAKAEELFGTLQAYLKIAAETQTADKFGDYTYETYYYRDRNGATVQGSRLTPGSRARWDQRNREVVRVWKEVRDAARDVLAVLKKHEKSLPEHLKKVREYSAECEKNASVVVK